MPKRPHRRGEAFFEKALLMNEMKRLPTSELSFRGPKGLFCFQCTEGNQPGSLHLLPPAPWMGACRIYKKASALAVSICIVREKGKGYQGEK
jgi:hypothetical protein